jgi:two-component system, NarL family, response regulator LiaR
MPIKPSKSGGRRKKRVPPAPRKGAASASKPGPKNEAVSPPRHRDARPLKIAVAAQPLLFREILSRQLDGEPSLIVVGRAGNEDQIAKLLAQESPLVLVFDYEGLGPNGESTVHRLRRAAPATRILVLASRSSDETVQRVLRAGASGLVGKQLEFTVLVRAIHAVAAGEVWANRRATSAALEGLTGSSGGASTSNLTKREQEIADACSRGLRNKEIAAHLNISTKTVKSHLNNIFRKLHVDNRLALALQISERLQPKT